MKKNDVLNKLVNLGIISENDSKYTINIQPESLFPISYGFEDVAIMQQKSVCGSRLNVNIKSEVVRGVFVDIPLIASNMSTVTNAEFAIKLYKLGALAILHRAQSREDIIEEVRKVAKECSIVSASVGIDDTQFDLAKDLIRNGCNIITIDIANSYTDSAIQLVKKIKEFSRDTKIILGNTTNVGLLEETFDTVDAIKIGIAQGFVCETKNTAGCTEKQFSAVLKFKELSKKHGMPLISDGGIREPADFVKSIAAGANSAMSGKIFAACPESAAEEILISLDEKHSTIKKVYAGMASRYVQNRWKGGLKKGTCPEGTVKYLDLGEPAESLLERYAGALRSGISYSKAFDIPTFHENVRFIRFK